MSVVQAARTRLYAATVEDWRTCTRQERIIIVASYVGPLYIGHMMFFGPTLLHMLPILAGVGFAWGIFAALFPVRNGLAILGSPVAGFLATGRPEAALPAMFLGGCLALLIPPPGGYPNAD